MKTLKFLFFIPALLLLSFTLAPQQLTKAERDSAIKRLTDSKEALLKSVKGLSPEQLKFKATPESWSIAECVEHITLSEGELYGLVQSTLKPPADPAKRSEIKVTDDQVYAGITDRSHKVKTQEGLKPTGKFGSTDATIKEFLTRRAATINYVKTTQDDLRNHFFAFPPELFGTVDSYQVVVFISGHSMRHIAQIEEVKANPAFPKK